VLGVVNRADREGGAVFLGAKQTAMAAPEATDEAGESVARANDKATGNTQELCRISVSSLLPRLVLTKSASSSTVLARTAVSFARLRT